MPNQDRGRTRWPGRSCVSSSGRAGRRPSEPPIRRAKWTSTLSPTRTSDGSRRSPRRRGPSPSPSSASPRPRSSGGAAPTRSPSSDTRADRRSRQGIRRGPRASTPAAWRSNPGIRRSSRTCTVPSCGRVRPPAPALPSSSRSRTRSFRSRSGRRSSPARAMRRGPCRTSPPRGSGSRRLSASSSPNPRSARCGRGSGRSPTRGAGRSCAGSSRRRTRGRKPSSVSRSWRMRSPRKGFRPTCLRSSCRTGAPGKDACATRPRRSRAVCRIRSSWRKPSGWKGSPPGTWAMRREADPRSPSWERPRDRDGRWKRSAGSTYFNADSNHFYFLRLAGEDLLGARGANGADGDLEEEALPGERMVQVDQHRILADLADRDRIALPTRGAGIETEPGFEVDLGGKEAARQGDDVVFLARAVRLVGGDAEGGLFAFAQALEGPLQRGKDLPATVQVVDGRFSDAGLDHLAGGQADEVIHRHNPAFFHAHEANCDLLARGGSASYRRVRDCLHGERGGRGSPTGGPEPKAEACGRAFLPPQQRTGRR